MIARKPILSDLAEIARMHAAMNVPYALPDLDGMMLSMVTDELGSVAAAGLRPTYEAFLWINPSRSPQDKWQAIQMLNAGCPADIDITAWPPPEIEKRFARRLTKLNWVKSPWSSWSKR